MSGSEKQVCPNRVQGREPNLLHKLFGKADTWETDRWKENDWSEGLGPKPRTCSYCGSAHPDDAIEMIEKKLWEIETTDKYYKWYLFPPGSLRRHHLMIKAIQSRIPAEEIFKTVPPDTGPPVKLYGWHGSPEQLDRLNRLLTAQEGANQSHH